MTQMEKPVALITGCSESKSLGAAFAIELLSRGWTVFATARKVETLEGLASAGCQTLALDVTSSESVAKAASAVSDHTGGRLNLLINNAGATGSAPVTQTDPAKLAAMHDLHVLGPLRMSQAFLPLLKEATNEKRRSKIVNIGSVISNGMPWHAAYATTKAGVQVLSDIMRREFRPFGIDVITIELALVKTAMTAGTKEFDLYLENSQPLGNPSAALAQASKYFSKETEKAPVPSDIAKEIIAAVESRSTPRKMYLGRNRYFFHWIVPYLPVAVADYMFSNIMRVDVAAQS